MKLLTKELARSIPPLYTTEEAEMEDKIAVVKLFHPLTDWTWYIIEFDGQDRCFGYVIGSDAEFGYFSLSELGAIGRGGGTIPIERDLYFDPTPISKILSGEAY